MKERIYQGVIVALLLTLLVFVVKSNDNYMDLLEVNESQSTLIEQQREDYSKIIADWEKSYQDLQTEYGKLLVEKNQLEEVELPTYDFTEAEIYLLAQCVQAEAGYYKGHDVSQKYVCQVILNRLHNSQFPNVMEEVIYHKTNGIPQFSVAYNGTLDQEVEPETLANVYEVIVHGCELPDYVMYFYSASVTENWVNNLSTYDTVQGTVFAYSNSDKE